MPAEPVHLQSETATLARQSGRLTAALRAVLRSSPLDGLGPIEVARALRIDKTLVSRLMTALRAPDPLVALSALPGTSPLRQFVRAAGEYGAAARAVAAADDELREFEQALQRTFGTRTRLDAALSDALPATRRRHQETARQSVFRGMALIKGVSIDLASITWVVTPSPAHPGHIDTRVLAGFVGIRRLRPTARMRFVGTYSRPVVREGEGLLREFCSPSDLSITTLRQEAMTVYEVTTNSVRQDAAANIFLTESLPRAPDPALSGGGVAYGESVAHPCKRLGLCLLIHKEVWPGCGFSVRAYDTAARGLVSNNYASRETDRLELDATVTVSGAGPEELRSVPIPAYADMLTSVCKLDDFAEFRMIRTEVAYPMYSAQILLVYEGPSRAS